jgi:hypothetical protein
LPRALLITGVDVQRVADLSISGALAALSPEAKALKARVASVVGGKADWLLKAVKGGQVDARVKFADLPRRRKPGVLDQKCCSLLVDVEDNITLSPRYIWRNVRASNGALALAGIHSKLRVVATVWLGGEIFDEADEGRV